MISKMNKSNLNIAIRYIYPLPVYFPANIYNQTVYMFLYFQEIFRIFKSSTGSGPFAFRTSDIEMIPAAAVITRADPMSNPIVKSTGFGIMAVGTS